MPEANSVLGEPLGELAARCKVWEYGLLTHYCGTSMKTTIEVSDELMRRAKHAALERDITLRALIEEALERVVGGTAERWPPIRTITFGHPLEPLSLADADFQRGANPDADDPAYVAKRLGLTEPAGASRKAPTR